MNKFIFTLATQLDSKSGIKKHYSPDTVISDLFDEDSDEIYWIQSLSELELIYGFEIPEELYDRTDLTLGEFADDGIETGKEDEKKELYESFKKEYEDFDEPTQSKFTRWLKVWGKVKNHKVVEGKSGSRRTVSFRDKLKNEATESARKNLIFCGAVNNLSEERNNLHDGKVGGKIK